MPTDQYRRRSNHRTAVASIIARMGLDVFAARYRINRRSAERLATGWHYVPKGLRDELVQTLTGLPEHKADRDQLQAHEIFADGKPGERDKGKITGIWIDEMETLERNATFVRLTASLDVNDD